MKAKSRWKMKAKIASFRRLLGFLLSVTLLLEASGMQVFAASMQDNIPDTSGVVDIADTANTEDTANTADTAKSYDSTVDEAEPTVGDPADDEIGTVDGEDTDIASGKYNGMDWRIDKDGLLTIEGKYQEDNTLDQAAPNWQSYSSKIIRAQIKAKGVKSTSRWFQYCYYLTNIDLSHFDTSSVTDMNGMFFDCQSLISLDLSNFDTGNVTDMGRMFYGCWSLTSLDLSNFDTGNVTDMGRMFDGCWSLTSLDLSNFDTSNVTDMGAMFAGCSALTSLDVSNFDTVNVTNMSAMFDLAWSYYEESFTTEHGSALTSLDVSSFDTSSVTGMCSMFYGCSSLTSLDVSNFNTSNVTDMASMFCGCSSLTSLDLTNFNTSNVTSMFEMFYECSSLTSLDSSNFDTGNVTDMGRMFYGCSSLTSLDLSSFNTSNVTDMEVMFSGCSNLEWINSPINLTIDIVLPFIMSDEQGKVYIKLPCEQTVSIKLTKTSVSSEDIIASGNWCGMDWTIDGDGSLTISGVCNNSYGEPDWKNYSHIITSAKVTATNVDCTSYWFSSCHNLQNIDFSSFDTSNVTDMERMFSGCSGLISLDLSNMNLTTLRDADKMFLGCSNLEWINSPVNLTIDIVLPFIMSDEHGTAYIKLPREQTIPIKLTKTSVNPEDIIASGNWCGMDWTIYGDGSLTVSGVCNNSYGEPDWQDYSHIITSAKVTGTNVQNIWRWFAGCYNLQNVDFNNFDTSYVTEMTELFRNCRALTNLDLSNINLTNLNWESFALYGCSNLESLNTPINLNIFVPLPHVMVDADGNTYATLPRGLSTSIKLTKPSTGGETEDKDIIASGKYKGMDWRIDKDGLLTIEGEYQEDAQIGTSWRDYCYKIIRAKVTATGVTSTNSWFENCYILSSVDLSNFDTSQVTDMSYMFYYCKSLASLDLSNFDTSVVTDMSYMFSYCGSLTSLDLSNFDTSMVTDMSYMFYYCSSLTSLDLSNFAPNNGTNIVNMFAKCHSLTNLTLSIFNINGTWHGMDWNIDSEGLLTISGEYQEDGSGKNWSSFKDLIKSAKVTATGVTSTNSWFGSCYFLSSVDLSNFDTSNVTDMSWMFDGCSALTSLDVSNFNTSKVTDMSGMFSVGDEFDIFTGSLNSLDVSNFDTSNVIDMRYMFSGCEKLSNLDISNFNTSKVTNMEYMFYKCSSLTDLDVSAFDTSRVTNVDYMFSRCNSLIGLDLSNMDFAKLDESDRMFRACTSLQWINTPLNLSIDIELPSIMGDEHGTIYITLPRNLTTSIKLTKTLGNPEDIIASGNRHGMDWTIGGDGSLTISGIYNEHDYNEVSWRDYSNIITSAKVTAANVQDTEIWFYSCYNLQSIDFSGFDASQITDMTEMFENCRSLTGLDLSSMNLAKLEYAIGMFYHCDNLEWINTPLNLNIDIDLPHVMVDADGNTYSTLPRGLATSIKLTKPSTGGETEDKDIIASGKYCGMDWRIDKNGLLTISGEYLEDDADADSSWPWLDYTNEVISAKVIATNVKLMNHWFRGCSNLQSIDFTDFDTSQVTDMTCMFDGCSSLTGLDLSNMNLASLKTADHMLDYCSNLEWINAPINLSISIALPFPMCDENGIAYIALPLGQAVSKKLTYTDGLAVAAIADQTYTGKAIKPNITVTYGKRTLTPGVDYTVTYKNNTNAAASDSAKAPTVIVKGKGNYTDSITETFNILAKPLTESNTTVASMTYTSDGKVKKPTPTVTVDGVKLKAGKDYIVEFPDTVSGAYRQPGRYSVTIKGAGNYQGTVTAALVILTKDQIQASKLKIGKLSACTYIEGTPAAPVPTVTYAGKELVQDKDYTISYRNNGQVGKATLIITGLENTDSQGVYVYGTVEKTFSIKGTALNKAKVNYDNKASFTGSAIRPVVTLTLNGAVLRPDTDYTVAYSNNINAGKATITLTGCGGYTGTVKKTFTIRPAETDTSKLDVTFAKDSATTSYSQSGAKPAVTVKINGTTLQSGKDYTTTYKNNKKPAGTDAAKAPTIIIKGKGNYKFQKSLAFSIVEKSLNDTDITVSAPDTFLGTKGSLLAAPTVIDGDNKKLRAGRDYIVTGYFINGQEFDGRSQVSSNTPVTVKLRGTGCYTDEIETTYRIAARDISKTKVTISQIEFNGGTTVLTDKMIQEGKIKVTDKATGQELVYGTDYIITGYQNNAKKGKATLTIQGTGENYGGTKAVKFSIVAKKLKK